MPLLRIYNFVRNRFLKLIYSSDALSNAIQEEIARAVYYVYTERVEGNLIEFGTHAGLSAKTLCIAMKNAFELIGERKNLYLVDSFEGLPISTAEPDLNNDHVKSGRWGFGKLKGLTPNELKKKCSKYLGQAGMIYVNKCWFIDFKYPQGDKVALINFDGDLFQSTVDALSRLFEENQISEGCVILFDDYFCGKGNPNLGESAAWTFLVQRYNISYREYKTYGIYGKSFIINNYDSRSVNE